MACGVRARSRATCRRCGSARAVATCASCRPTRPGGRCSRSGSDGRSAALDLPVEEQIDIIAATLQRAWQPVPDAEPLRTGAEQAAWLREYVRARWEDLDRPCPEQTITRAQECAAARRDAFDATTAVLIHGDAHPANVLEDPNEPGRFKLIDPDGMRSEPAHDLAIPLRDWTHRAARRRSRRARPRLVRTARRAAVRSTRGRSGSGPSSNGSRPGSSCCRCTIRSARRCSPSPTNGPQSELSASSSTRSGPPRREPASSTPSR